MIKIKSFSGVNKKGDIKFNDFLIGLIFFDDFSFRLDILCLSILNIKNYF